MNRSLRLSLACSLALMLSACFSNRSAAPVSYSNVKTTATPHINSKLVSKNMLLINSTKVGSVKLGARVESGISEANLKQLLFDVARERLQFEVLAADSSAAVDGILELELASFKQLQGSFVGASQGAEVGFALKMFSVRTRELLWEANFFHKDIPLSDDIFALGRKEANSYGYNNANNLLKNALNQALGELNDARKDLFLTQKK